MPGTVNTFKMDDSLTTEQITCNLSSHLFTQPYFEGVFALDELPTSYLTHRPSLVVCNTAFSHSPGEHWVCFFLGDNFVEFFDSYGTPPSHKNLLDFISVNGGLATNYNTRCLQSLTATTCGKYVTTFLLFRSLGFSLDQYLNLFASARSPDYIVRKLYQSHFKKSMLTGGQTCRVRAI